MNHRAKETNYLFYASWNPSLTNNPFLEKIRQVTIDHEIHVDEKIYSLEDDMPNDLEMLRMQLVEKQTIIENIRKEREKEISKQFQEREQILRNISTYKEEIKRASITKKP